MKKITLLSIAIAMLALGSCEKNLIEAIQPKPAKNIKQAKARLTAVAKWTIEEAYENGVIIYQNGVNSSNDADIDINYVKFRADGVFEVSYKSYPLDESLRWKIDEVKNILSIFDTTNKDYREDWQIEAGSVYEDWFEMSYEYENIEYKNGVKTTYLSKMKIKMKRLE